MTFEFLIIVTSVGLVFATLLCLVLSCEMPEPIQSARPERQTQIDRTLTKPQTHTPIPVVVHSRLPRVRER